MDTVRGLVVGLFSAVLMVGCAHGKMGRVDEPLKTGAFDKTTVIYVTPVDAHDTIFSGDKSADAKTTDMLRARIHNEFDQRIVEALTKRGYAARVANDKVRNGLELVGHTTRIENGSAAARYFVGMGAGSANMFTTFSIIDTTKGNTVAKFEVIGTSGGSSGLGSFMDNHLNDSSKKVAEYIDTSLNPKK